MALWSRLKALLGVSSAGAPATDPPAATPLVGTIDDWNPRTTTGVVTLSDGAMLSFGREAAAGFVPLIGLRVQVLATGVPPDGEEAELWATALRLLPGTEAEYAARRRIDQVERAVRGQAERAGRGGAPSASQDEPAPSAGQPPWARNKAGRKPAGPGRPLDAFFVLTVALTQELPAQGPALAALLAGPRWPRPSVRIIPLVRKGRPEAGFSAEILTGSRRAFLLCRSLPYASGDGQQQGRAHVGLFVGGPHSPRVLAQLGGPAADAAPLAPDGEAYMLSDLLRALLRREPGALGVVVNRAGKAWKPRDIALSQLGEDDGEGVPFMLWIDWNVAAHQGRPCQVSSGMESLGLPDVAVALPAADAQDRCRDVLWYACRSLVRGDLAADATVLRVPRRLRLLPGSQLLIDDANDCDTYRVRARDVNWLELEPEPKAVTEPTD